MAMLLPIMVGLQTAVSVSELEQGDLAILRSSESSPVKGLEERMVFKWKGDGCVPAVIGEQEFILREGSLFLLSATGLDREDEIRECQQNNKI